MKKSHPESFKSQQKGFAKKLKPALMNFFKGYGCVTLTDIKDNRFASLK